jgi:two-component system response regulator VicR
METAQERKRLLCVEDNPDICELVSAILTDFQVISANSVAEAWDRYDEYSYSLIILDHHLADGTGLDFCSKLRALDPFVPVIFFTSDPEITPTMVNQVGAQSLVSKGDPDFLAKLLEIVTRFTVATA